MSAYTAQITLYVTTNFPIANFPNPQQANLIALGEAVAALVIPGQSTKQYTVAMWNVLINDPNFAFMPKDSPIFNQLLVLCEYCLDLALIANAPGGLGAKFFMGYATQVGVAAPAWEFGGPLANSPNCSFSEAPVFEYSGVGDYLIKFPSIAPFVDSSKVEIITGAVGVKTIVSNIKCFVSSATKLNLQSFLSVADPITGVISAALSNDCVSLTLIKVTVYP